MALCSTSSLSADLSSVRDCHGYPLAAYSTSTYSEECLSKSLAENLLKASVIEVAVFVIKLSLVTRSNLLFAGHLCPYSDIEVARLVVDDAYQKQNVYYYQGSGHSYEMFAVTLEPLTVGMAAVVIVGF